MRYDYANVPYPQQIAALGDLARGRSVVRKVVVSKGKEVALPLAVFSDEIAARETRDILNAYPELLLEIEQAQLTISALENAAVGVPAQSQAAPAPQPQPNDPIRQLVIERLNALLSQMDVNNPARAGLQALLTELGN